MVEYLQGTAGRVLALKTKFYKEHYSNLSKKLRGLYENFRQKIFCYEYLVY